MPSLKLKTLLYLCYLFTLSLSTVSQAQSGDNELAPLALGGYDPVTYFISDKVRIGNNQYQETYKGQRYIFLNKENQQLFVSDPEQFLPQFGGHCAHTATAQSPVPGDPSIYLVENGKLFLFSSEAAKNNWPSEVTHQQVSLIPLALQGYDVTTYFGENTPVNGSEVFHAVFNGKRYIFISKENQQKFASNPERFVPQYGGYCSHAASEGKPIESNPAIYLVDQDRLFLFSQEDAREKWAAKATTVRDLAHQDWQFKANKRNKQIAAKNRWKKDSKVLLFNF